MIALALMGMFLNCDEIAKLPHCTGPIHSWRVAASGPMRKQLAGFHGIQVVPPGAKDLDEIVRGTRLLDGSSGAVLATGRQAIRAFLAKEAAALQRAQHAQTPLMNRDFDGAAREAQAVLAEHPHAAETLYLAYRALAYAYAYLGDNPHAKETLQLMRQYCVD